MNQYTKKLLTVICEAALENVLKRDMEKLGATGYTITDARGKGARGVRSASWDASSNIRFEVICDEAIARQIADHLRKHYYDNFAMVLMMSDVEVLRPQKF